METTRPRLHPLLTAAAISVSVFSAVGVGALTGLLPQSSGSQQEAAPLEQKPLAEKPAELRVQEVTPAPKRHAAAPAKPAVKAPVAHREYAEPPRVVQAPAAYEAPKPIAKPWELGTVAAVREVKQPGEHTGLGPIAGGVAGAVIGDQIGGKGNTRKVLTVLGAAGGALAGREIERHARSTTRWEVEVRHDDGRVATVASEVSPGYRTGDRVRVVDGRLQPA